MTTIVTRLGKGSSLTYAEGDANFTNLNTDKVEAGDTRTFTNKTINLANNTLSGTMAEFDAACSNGNFSYDGHAHAASVITVADAGNRFTSTDVEGCLAEAFDAGLQYFTESRTTAAPNATIPAHALSATEAQTNIDAVVVPKGTGAFLLQIPDNAATGGNKRGSNAVDLQKSRTAADQVASGDGAVLVGGANNKASGGSASCIAGAENVADGDRSSIQGGQYATAREMREVKAHSSGRFNTLGDSQERSAVLRQTTTDATPLIACTDSSTPRSGSTSNVFVLPDNHSYLVGAYVIARQPSTGDTKTWRIEGTAKRGSGAGTTAILGTPSVTILSQDTNASTWAIELIADTTEGAVEVRVTGQAAKTIRWTSRFDTVEIG